MNDLFIEYLKANLPKSKSFHPFFNEALAFMLEAGGKHFRAQLLLGVVNALNKELLKPALKAALALELIHTYSLIHDDLPAMDNSDLRRGYKTLHKKYDELTAILVGDALNTEAFYVLARIEGLNDKKKLALIELLSFNAGLNGMVLGQILDCHFEKQRLSLDKLEFLHLHKTGRLIAAALAMGAVIVGVDEKSYYELGLKLGLIFQINDDIMDETLSEEQMGKPAKQDGFKNSYVNLLGLDEAIKRKDLELNMLLKMLEDFDPKIASFIKNLIKKYL